MTRDMTVRELFNRIRGLVNWAGNMRTMGALKDHAQAQILMMALSEILQWSEQVASNSKEEESNDIESP